MISMTAPAMHDHPVSVSLDDELLTEEEFAEIARTTVDTVRSWRRGGSRGPAWVRPGKAPLYRRSDVQAWIAGLTTPRDA